MSSALSSVTPGKVARKLGRAPAATVAILRRMLFDLWFNRFVASDLVPADHRWRVLRLSGLAVNRSVILAGGFIGSRQIRIGKDCTFNRNVFLDGSGRVEIGDGVGIGMNVTIITSDHEIGGPVRRAGELQAKPVSIEDGAWIGAHAVISPGITVGHGAVVATGSVVMKDVAPNTVVMGNPARVVRQLDAELRYFG